MIMVIIENRHHAYKLLQEPEAVFAVNILGEEQSELSNRFAWVKDEDRFAQGNWTQAVTGAPVLADALAWLDLRREPGGRPLPGERLGEPPEPGEEQEADSAAAIPERARSEALVDPGPGERRED